MEESVAAVLFLDCHLLLDALHFCSAGLSP